MSPFSVICDMNLSPADKVALFLIQLGISDAARIDIHIDMDGPDVIKTALFQIGLAFTSMPTSGKSSHLCGLAVSKKKSIAEEFAKAAAENDQVKVRKLMGYQLIFPVTRLSLPIIKQLQDKAPILYNELVQSKLIAA